MGDRRSEEVGVTLKYIIPEEGSNVWFDGWCIPIYAKNPKAASWFINYLCIPENAIKNMAFIGYVSVIGTPEVLEWANDSVEWPECADLSYFFGENATAVHANQVLYPDKSIIDRCALMHDAGDMNEELVRMWNRVKGDNLSVGKVVFIVVVVVAIVGFVVFRIVKKRSHTRSKYRKQRKV